ncbi:hypothetical protein BJV74DRAFT_887605 [Russula compacta]|nr:hypothetical protein BJV74DRAFT_887605 [Russula compacta]
MLDIWPALPIVILSFESDSELLMESADNIFAALEHDDRFKGSASTLRAPSPESTFLYSTFLTSQLLHFLRRTENLKLFDEGELSFIIASRRELQHPTMNHTFTFSAIEYPGEQDNIENMRWLELLRLFTAAKDLRLSGQVVPRVAAALQELVGERVTTELPALQNLFVPQQWLVAGPSRPVRVGAFEQFAAVRQLYGHPVTAHVMKMEVDCEWMGI